MADIKNHYSQQQIDNKLVTTVGQQQPIETVPVNNQSCIEKVQRKFEECTDILANYFQCTRVFSTQKLQQLRRKAINNQRDSQSYNKTTKSEISEQSQKYSQLQHNKDQLKSYTKKQKDLLIQDYNQLPAHNYSSNQRLRFTKRYAQIYQKSYTQRKNKFGYTFQQVQLDRQRQYLKKSKNCWEEFKRLICCRGGNYLQQLQEVQVQTDALSQNNQLNSIKSSVKKQPTLASNKYNKQQNNIFLFEQQLSPKYIQQQPVFTKHGRKVNKNIKIINNNQGLAQQKQRKSQILQNNSEINSQQKQLRKNYGHLGVDTQLLVKRKQFQQKTEGDYIYKQNYQNNHITQINGQSSQPQLGHKKSNHFNTELQQYKQSNRYNNANNNQDEYRQISDEQAQEIRKYNNNKTDSNIDTISSNRTNQNIGNNYNNNNSDNNMNVKNNNNNRNDTFNMNNKRNNDNNNPYNNYNTIGVTNLGNKNNPTQNQPYNDNFEYKNNNNGNNSYNNDNNNDSIDINNRYNTIDITNDRQLQGVPKIKIDKKAKMSKMMKQIEDQNDQQFNSSQVVFFSDDIKSNNNGQLPKTTNNQTNKNNKTNNNNNNNNNNNSNNNNNNNSNNNSNNNRNQEDQQQQTDNNNPNYQRIKKSKNKGKQKFKFDQPQQQQPAIDIIEDQQSKHNQNNNNNQSTTNNMTRSRQQKNKSNKLIIKQQQNMGYTLDQIPNIEQPEHVGPQTSAFKKKRKAKKNMRQVQQPQDIDNSQIIFQQNQGQNNDGNVGMSKFSGYSENTNQNMELSEMKNAPQQMFKKKKNKRKNLVVKHEDDGQEVLDLEDM